MRGELLGIEDRTEKIHPGLAGGVLGLTIGILICYDRHFPEAARVLGMKGAHLLLVPTAIVIALWLRRNKIEINRE